MNGALGAKARGQPPRKRVQQATRELQECLWNLYNVRREGQKSASNALHGFVIRFVCIYVT